METNSTKSNKNRIIVTWMFYPFHYVAGGASLVTGLCIIFITGYLGSLSNTHFDGIIDIHTGLFVPLWFFVLEGFLNWIVIGVLLLIGGYVISKSKIRIIDVFGTQALARAPMLFAALVAILPGYFRFSEILPKLIFKTVAFSEINRMDILVFSLAVLVMLAMIIWMVILMYQAFSISCNVKGSKAITVFIAALFIGEIIIKILLSTIAGHSIVPEVKSWVDPKTGYKVDEIDYPFINDSEVIGRWESIDFVKNIEDFKTTQKQWKSKELSLKELVFLENGKTTSAYSWTRGLVLHPKNKTASKYLIRQINGEQYLFFEWKSGDYYIRHWDPYYYVLKKSISK